MFFVLHCITFQTLKTTVDLTFIILLSLSLSLLLNVKKYL